MLSIRSQNTFNDIRSLEELFDFSNLAENPKLIGNQNKKNIGK